MSNTATPAIRKFLAEHASTVDSTDSSAIHFTAKSGRRAVIMFKDNGSLDQAYTISRSGDFGPGASSLKALAQRIA